MNKKTIINSNIQNLTEMVKDIDDAQLTSDFAKFCRDNNLTVNSENKQPQSPENLIIKQKKRHL